MNKSALFIFKHLFELACQVSKSIEKLMLGKKYGSFVGLTISYKWFKIFKNFIVYVF